MRVTVGDSGFLLLYLCDVLQALLNSLCVDSDIVMSVSSLDALTVLVDALKYFFYICFPLLTACKSNTAFPIGKSVLHCAVYTFFTFICDW